MIIAQVDGVSELQVCFDRVESLVLQSIRAQLFHQPDAAALLMLVKQYSCAFFGDYSHGQVELIVTVTAQGMENISRGALRVDADHGGQAVNIAKNKSQGALPMVSLVCPFLVYFLKA